MIPNFGHILVFYLAFLSSLPLAVFSPMVHFTNHTMKSTHCKKVMGIRVKQSAP